MVTSPARSILLAAALLLLGPPIAHSRCDPTADPDKSDIATARAAVAAHCDCTTLIHRAFVSCGAQQASLVLMNKSCASAVKHCASKSICGKPGSVTCCRTNAQGRTSCTIKSTATKCTAPKGGRACTGNFASCCDACTQGGCATTTTTTSSTSSTTTTTTTLPRIPCAGGTTPQCTDGVCAAGEQCGPNSEISTLTTECDCFPAGVTPCVLSGFPQCGGVCVGGLVCGGFESYDPQTMTFMRSCGCVDPTASCSFNASQACQPGYCAPPLVCGFSPISPAGPVCGCGGPT